MSLIEFPIVYIPNPTQGKPLFYGQIFVGIPDLDPEIVVNQKQLRIVQEDGTKVDVPQPFILSAGGVPVYNDATVRLSVNGNYSLKILDKNGAQAYFIDNVFEGQPITQEFAGGFFVRKYDSVQLAIDSTLLAKGDSLMIKEYHAGIGGGGAEWDVVTVGAVLDVNLPNGTWIRQCAGVDSLALVLRIGAIIDIDELGAIADAGGANTDNSSIIKAACDIGGKIIFGNNGGSGTGIYGWSSAWITTTKSCYIDLNDTTIARVGGTGGFFEATGIATDLSIKDGELDVQNLSSNFGHTIIFNSEGGKLDLQGVKCQNNIVGFGNNPPTPEQDTDLVDVVTAKEVHIERCTFFRASRQGVSVTAAVPKITIKNNHFEDCYLFGVDVEPNIPAFLMYEEINIHNNTFKNCGPKSETDFIWNSGGPFAVAAAANTAEIMVRTLNVYDNEIISSDFLNASATRVEPFAKLDNYQSLRFENNKFDNLDRVIIATIDGSANILSTIITNNIMLSTFGGNMQGNLACYYSDRLIVTGSNELRGFTYSANKSVVIDGNSFKDTPSALIANDTRPQKIIITNNEFTDCVTCIDTTNLSTKYTIIGNHSTGDTTFCLSVTNSTVALNQSDGSNVNGQFKASSNTVGVDYELGSPNGVQIKYNREDTAVTLNDEYFILRAESENTSNPGIVGTLACIKDIANSDAYGAWELTSGLGGATVSHLYSDFNGHLLPSRDIGQDNTQNLGSPTIRWATIYAGTGAIDTSDETLKQQVELLTEKEKAVATRLKGLIRTFKFNDAVELKGDNARIHVGVIAQDVFKAFEAVGLNGNDYAMFCLDTFYTLDGKVCNILKGDNQPIGSIKNDRLGIRYSELLAFIISAM